MICGEKRNTISILKCHGYRPDFENTKNCAICYLCQALDTTKTYDINQINKKPAMADACGIGGNRTSATNRGVGFEGTEKGNTDRESVEKP